MHLDEELIEGAFVIRPELGRTDVGLAFSHSRLSRYQHEVAVKQIASS